MTDKLKKNIVEIAENIQRQIDKLDEILEDETSRLSSSEYDKMEDASYVISAGNERLYAAIREI